MQLRGLCFVVFFLCFFCAGFVSAQNPVLEGYVVNSVTGQPIPEARVKVTRPDTEPLYTKTDAQGRFQLAIPEGRGYYAWANKPGFAPNPTRVGFSFSYRANNPIKLELDPVGVIAGKVTDSYGLPLQNCTIEMLRKLPDAAARIGAMRAEYQSVSGGNVNTNDLGEFRAARLKPGAYYVVVNKTGGLTPWPDDYRITYYPRALDLASAKVVEVAAGREARADIQVVRREGVAVKGRLIMPDGQEAPPGRVRYTNLMLVPQGNQLMNANGPFAMARTDDFEFPNVLPGKYTLMVLTRERPDSDTWGSSEKSVFGIAREIEIKDKGIAGLDLAVQPLRDLSGAITFAEGCTPVPVLVRAIGTSQLDRAAAEGISDPDGKFLLRGLTPAKYSLSFSSAASPFRWFQPVSAALGDTNILEGFDYPPAGNGSLKIVLGCATNGRPR